MGQRLGLEKPWTAIPKVAGARARTMNDALPRPLSDAPAEMERVLEAAEVHGVVLRAIGGLAIYLRCPSARRPPLQRTYKDLDLVGRSGQAQRIDAVMEELGYVADREFNLLHGHQRLYFWDRANERQLDVFIDNFEMCHPLALKDRLDLEARTLPLADLLLTKLQVVEVNQKDLKDASALLVDHEISPDGIDPERVTSLLGGDWGWWRTTSENLARVRDHAASLEGLDGAPIIAQRIERLLKLIEEAPKTLKWKLRARVGEKVRWYNLPEEVDA